MLEDRQLSQMFIRKGLLDEETLEKANKLCEERGASLYDVLLREALVDEEKAIVAVSKQLNLPCVSLKEFEANDNILDLIDQELARKFDIMPLGLTEEDGVHKLYLAMANPLDIEAIEEVSKASGYEVVQLLAGPVDIETAIERSYAASSGGSSGESDTKKSFSLSGDDLGLNNMLDGLFDGDEGGDGADGESDEQEKSNKGLGLGGFTLDFGDLSLSVGKKAKAKSEPKKDVHDRMTLPAGTELPKDLSLSPEPEPASAASDEAGTPAKPAAAVAAAEEQAAAAAAGGDAGPMDDWSDLATFGLADDDEAEAPAAASPMMTPPSATTRTENSTVRYVADPALQNRGGNEGFPYNIPSTDLVRATVKLLVDKGILTEKQIREEVKKLRHGGRRRR